MIWKGRRGSSNVEDRRGSGGGKPIKGGLGLIFVAVLTYFMSDGDLGQVFKAVVNNQSTPTSTSNYKPSKESIEQTEFVSVVLKDTEDVWNKIFAKYNKNYQEPKLVLFNRSTKSACGMANSATGPFYCPRDYKVYLDLNFFREMKNKMNAPGDFASAYVIAHEVGHHVQNLLGTLSKVHNQRKNISKTDGNKLQVKVELQADCYAGIWAYHAQKMKHILQKGDIEEAIGAASAVGDDTLQKKSRGFVVPDSFTHGSSAQRVKWFKIGFESGNIDRCNTFGIIKNSYISRDDDDLGGRARMR